MDASDGLLVKTAGLVWLNMSSTRMLRMVETCMEMTAYLPFRRRVADEAEAKIRLGQNGDDEVNQVRNRVGAKPLQNVTLDTLLDERMLELAWEGVRRQDLIRFGKFTEATVDRYVGVKHSASSLDYQEDKTGYTTVFSIYADILSLNPNLTQNPGY